MVISWRGQSFAFQLQTQVAGATTKVCGSNGMTYASECALKKAACEVQILIEINYRGDCGKFYNYPTFFALTSNKHIIILTIYANFKEERVSEFL